MLPKEVLEKLDVALEQFGTYNYYDKGVDEVFDADGAIAHVKTLSSTAAITFLLELAKHKHGEHLVCHMVLCCDTDTDEKWFDEVVAGCHEAGLEVY